MTETQTETNTPFCYLIECRTGCSCCADENHVRGPFSTLDIADAAIEKFREIALIGSQYARKGVYYIYAAPYEQLPDGRIIVSESYVVKQWADADPTSEDAKYVGNLNYEKTVPSAASRSKTSPQT